MQLIRATLKRSFIALTVAIQVFGYSPLANFSRIAVADETTAPVTEAVVPPAPCPTVNGTNAPTGAGSHTFTFIPAPTCLWENAYYSWSPVTKIYTPKYDTRVCDLVTDICERVNWQYVSSDGRYVETRTIISAPATATTNASPSLDSTATGNGAEAGSSGSSIVSGNGTGSDNSITGDSNLTGNFDLINNISVLTALNSNATSGDAAALFNTTVGNVGTGDAATIANVLNMIQSSWNPANGDITLFSADLFNNYFGDLLFDPSIVLGNGTGSTNNIANSSNKDLTVNIEENASIENNINLNAQSGNATANGNTTVGDVSTGDATAIANVINMINSMITAGNSFIGSINLYGDLNGDILLPRSLMDILLGNGTNSSNTITDSRNTDIDANTSTNSSITNNTNLTASSGDATADANTTVGNIATGNADTSVNEMNLIGQNVQGSKGLLVFVNVLGSWIGMLFGSPMTASIAGGNGSNSTNNITNNSTTDADIDINRNFSILNNLNLNAASGNATANANTTVGNVSTGNASTGVNLLNMIDSSMNFTDWFGVLFINVFGSWTGDFGNNTAAGDKDEDNKGNGQQPTHSQAGLEPAVSSPGVAATAASRVASAVTTFGRGGGSATGGSSSNVASAATTTTAASTTTGQTSSTQTTHEEDENKPAEAAARQGGNIWLPVVFGLFAAALIFGERILTLIRRP